ESAELILSGKNPLGVVSPQECVTAYSLVEFEEVVNGRVAAACSAATAYDRGVFLPRDGTARPRRVVLWVPPRALVGKREARDLCICFVVTGVCHPRPLENVFADVIREWLSGYLFDDGAQHHEAGVAVLDVSAWVEGKRFLGKEREQI